MFELAVPVGLALIGYLVMKSLVLDLLDEVYLDSDEIVIRNAGDEDRFNAKNILNVDTSVMTNPERITLTLREPCRFGSEVTFSPPVRFLPFGRHPLAKELIRLAHSNEGFDSPKKL